MNQSKPLILTVLASLSLFLYLTIDTSLDYAEEVVVGSNVEKDNTMITEKEKQDLIEGLSTNTKYYFTNNKEKHYKVLLISQDNKNEDGKYKLTLSPPISFQTTPLLLEKIMSKSVNQTFTKVALYEQLDKDIEALFTSGYSDFYLGTDEYYDEEEKYISDVTAGVPYRDYYPSSALSIHTVETSKGQFLRYDVYETAIKVSKDQRDKKAFSSEEYYTLWYPNRAASQKAIQSLLETQKTTTYSLLEFKALIEALDFERVEHTPAEIMYEHLVDQDAYISQDMSGLQLPIPQSAFEKFDPSNLEEGRIYFWIKKNEKSLLKSEIQFFVLQSRSDNGYVIGSGKLGAFNESRGNYVQTQSMSDEIGHLKSRTEEGFVEISQEEVIEILTEKKANEVLSQPLDHSIYLNNHVYDIYENIIQHWGSGTDREDVIQHTFFFNSKEKRDQWMKLEIANQKSNGYGATTFKGSAALLKQYQMTQDTNKKYQVQKVIKDELLANHPDLRAKLDDYNYRTFMKYSPLKIIEGDYEVDGSLLFDADETSIFITGDLIVSGTLSEKANSIFGSDNYLIVAGDVRIDNFVQVVGFRFKLFANNFIVKNIVYLPAASRSWYINIAGKLKTDIFIHAKDFNVAGKDENIEFNTEYSTTNKAIFTDGFFGKRKRADEYYIFETLKQGKSVLAENLDQEEISDALLLTAFKNHLKHWHDLYYEFAGFELQELGIGEHYGHYIESDQIVKDVRYGTGMYLMSHDDYSLSLVKAEKKLGSGELASEKLAYRFFWVMWTFSDWKHRHDGPMDYWSSIERIDTRFENGKPYYKEDPHLALYWIMHFGLLEDSRYDEIKSIMKDSDNTLVKGAFLFFDELKKTKTYAIELDRKQNTELFKTRIAHHKAQIEKAKIPEKNKVAYILSQFEKQPTRVIEFTSELAKGKQWDKISDYLSQNPYQVGFSFLHILVNKETGAKKDVTKWQTLFVQEADLNKDVWNEGYLLVDMFDVFYQDLAYEDMSIVVPIVMEKSSSSSQIEKYGKLYEHFKGLKKPKDSSNAYEKRLRGFTKDNFDFQTFINTSQDIELDKRIDFIRLCIKKDLFNEKVDRKAISPYLLMWYLADKDFYPVHQAKRDQEIKEVVTHYKLNLGDFEAKFREASKADRNGMLKPIKKYLIAG